MSKERSRSPDRAVQSAEAEKAKHTSSSKSVRASGHQVYSKEELSIHWRIINATNMLLDHHVLASSSGRPTSVPICLQGKRNQNDLEPWFKQLDLSPVVKLKHLQLMRRLSYPKPKGKDKQ